MKSSQIPWKSLQKGIFSIQISPFFSPFFSCFSYFSLVFWSFRAPSSAPCAAPPRWPSAALRPGLRGVAATLRFPNHFGCFSSFSIGFLHFFPCFFIDFPLLLAFSHGRGDLFRRRLFSPLFLLFCPLSHHRRLATRSSPHFWRPMGRTWEIKALRWASN